MAIKEATKAIESCVRHVTACARTNSGGSGSENPASHQTGRPRGVGRHLTKGRG